MHQAGKHLVRPAPSSPLGPGTSRRPFPRISLIALVAAFVALSACGESEPSGPSDESPGLRLSARVDSLLFNEIDQTRRLEVDVQDEEGRALDADTVRVEVADPSVVSFERDPGSGVVGRLTAVGDGITTVGLRAGDASDTLAVTVISSALDFEIRSERVLYVHETGTSFTLDVLATDGGGDTLSLDEVATIETPGILEFTGDEALVGIAPGWAKVVLTHLDRRDSVFVGVDQWISFASGSRNDVLRLIRPDGSDERTLGEGCWQAPPPTWNARGDGLYCVPQSGHVVVEVLLDGSRRTVYRVDGGETIENMALSPDGDLLAVQEGRREGDSVYVEALLEIDPASGSVRDTAHHFRQPTDPGSFFGRSRSIHWSPSGDSLVFTALVDDGTESTSSLVLRSRPEDETRLLFPDTAFSHMGRWSPTGDRISYLAGRLEIVEIGTGRVSPGPENYGAPIWLSESLLGAMSGSNFDELGIDDFERERRMSLLGGPTDGYHWMHRPAGGPGPVVVFGDNGATAVAIVSLPDWTIDFVDVTGGTWSQPRWRGTPR